MNEGIVESGYFTLVLKSSLQNCHILGILKKVVPTFFKFMANRQDKGRFSKNHLICDAHNDNLIRVRESNITIFEV